MEETRQPRENLCELNISTETKLHTVCMPEASLMRTQIPKHWEQQTWAQEVYSITVKRDCVSACCNVNDHCDSLRGVIEPLFILFGIYCCRLCFCLFCFDSLFDPLDTVGTSSDLELFWITFLFAILDLTASDNKVFIICPCVSLWRSNPKSHCVL